MCSSPLWPRQSNSLCWHCCHAFEYVPVYLPSQSTSRPWHLYFSGNFCSWNCAKAYLFEKNVHKRKDNTLQILSLLAFVSSYRPTHCPHPFMRHSSECPCLSKYHGIRMAFSKTVLIAFGGTMDIKTYRQDFMILKDTSHVTNYLENRSMLSSNFDSITSNPRLRSYTYSFGMIPKTIQLESSSDEQKQKQNIPKPVVYKKSIKHRTLC